MNKPLMLWKTLQDATQQRVIRAFSALSFVVTWPYVIRQAFAQCVEPDSFAVSGVARDAPDADRLGPRGAGGGYPSHAGGRWTEPV